MGQKLYYILMIIREHECISAKNILEELKKYGITMNIKSIYQYVSILNDLFQEWIQGDIITVIPRKGYTITNDFFLDGELQFLIDSLVYHQDLNEKDQDTITQKLLFLSSIKQREHIVYAKTISKNMTFSLIHNLTTIMKAIQNKKVISFQYIDYIVKNKRVKEVASHQGQLYYLSPYQIVLNNNHYYIVGYSPLRPTQLSTYRVDRMRVIQTTREEYIDVRDQFQMEKEIHQMMNMFSSYQRATITLQCHHKLLREMVSRFGKDIVVEKIHMDEYMITIENVPISEGLIGWIFMLQDQIKVIAPMFLKEMIEERLRRMVNQYTDMV